MVDLDIYITVTISIVNSIRHILQEKVDKNEWSGYAGYIKDLNDVDKFIQGFLFRWKNFLGIKK